MFFHLLKTDFCHKVCSDYSFPFSNSSEILHNFPSIQIPICLSVEKRDLNNNNKIIKNKIQQNRIGQMPKHKKKIVREKAGETHTNAETQKITGMSRNSLKISNLSSYECKGP